MRLSFRTATWAGLAVIAFTAGSGVRADDNKRVDDQGFVKKVSCAGACEVKSGEIALQRASDSKVKEFAQRMIDDHVKASKELEQLATSKGWMLTKTIEEKEQKELDKLSGATGQEFDQAYMQCQVKAHEEAVKLFQKESESGQDADLKAWAGKTLPTIQEHLKMAKEISDTKKK